MPKRLIFVVFFGAILIFLFPNTLIHKLLLILWSSILTLKIQLSLNAPSVSWHT